MENKENNNKSLLEKTSNNKENFPTEKYNNNLSEKYKKYIKFNRMRYCKKGCCKFMWNSYHKKFDKNWRKDKIRPKKSVGIILFHRDRILFVQSYCYKWGFPKGGLNPGETYREGALRELYEETGISSDYIKPTNLVIRRGNEILFIYRTNIVYNTKSNNTKSKNNLENKIPSNERMSISKTSDLKIIYKDIFYIPVLGDSSGIAWIKCECINNIWNSLNKMTKNGIYVLEKYNLIKKNI